MCFVSVTHIGPGRSECKLTSPGCEQDGAGSGWVELERMRPYRTSARQALFGASDPKDRRWLGSPQVCELPNFFISLSWLASCWCKTCGACGRWRNECESSKISHLSGDLYQAFFFFLLLLKTERSSQCCFLRTCLCGCVQADLCLPCLHCNLPGCDPVRILEAV